MTMSNQEIFNRVIDHLIAMVYATAACIQTNDPGSMACWLISNKHDVTIRNR